MWPIEEELKQSEDFDFRADLMRELNPTVAEIFEESRARLPQEGGTLHPAPANGRAPQEIQTL